MKEKKYIMIPAWGETYSEVKRYLNNGLRDTYAYQRWKLDRAIKQLGAIFLGEIEKAWKALKKFLEKKK
jgi:hypothetical protein